MSDAAARLVLVSRGRALDQAAEDLHLEATGLKREAAELKSASQEVERRTVDLAGRIAALKRGKPRDNAEIARVRAELDQVGAEARRIIRRSAEVETRSAAIRHEGPKLLAEAAEIERALAGLGPMTEAERPLYPRPEARP